MVTLFTDTIQLSLSPIIGVLHALGVCERENNDWLDIDEVLTSVSSFSAGFGDGCHNRLGVSSWGTSAIPMLVDGCGGVDVSVPSVIVISSFSSSPIIENKLDDVGD